MAKTYNTLTELFTDIANAIRTKTKTTASIVADDFPQELENLKMGDTLALIDGSIRTLKYNDLAGVETIRPYAFYGCANLETVTIHNDVTSIGENAFGECGKLEEIYIPKSSEGKIEGSPWGAENAEVIYYSEGLSYRLASDQAQYSVVGIGKCTDADVGVPSVYNDLPVTTIGDWAFSYCLKLRSITYQGTMSQWNSISFGSNWNASTVSYTIHCTDGDIPKA